MKGVVPFQVILMHSIVIQLEEMPLSLSTKDTQATCLSLKTFKIKTHKIGSVLDVLYPQWWESKKEEEKINQSLQNTWLIWMDQCSKHSFSLEMHGVFMTVIEVQVPFSSTILLAWMYLLWSKGQIVKNLKKKLKKELNLKIEKLQKLFLSSRLHEEIYLRLL